MAWSRKSNARVACETTRASSPRRRAKPSRDLGERHRVAVRVLDPGGPEAAGIEDAAPVGLEPGLVVLLEDNAPRRELVHRLLEVFDELAGERRRRLAGVVWREIDEDPCPVRAWIAHALLLLLAGHQPQLVLVKALCPVEVGYGQQRLDAAIAQSHRSLLGCWVLQRRPPGAARVIGQGLVVEQLRARPRKPGGLVGFRAG